MYLQRKNEEIEYPEDATGIYAEKKGYFPLFKLPNSKTFNKKSPEGSNTSRFL